jgi:citrate synthase
MRLLTARLEDYFARERATIGAIVRDHGALPVSDVTVNQLYGGLRGVIGIVCDTSEVDPQRGLFVRGTPVAELAGRSAEEVFHLLLTGALPDAEALAELETELSARRVLPDWLPAALAQLPEHSHAVVRLCVALQLLQGRSRFAAAYDTQPRGERWRGALEDALDIVAVLPELVSLVYRGELALPDPLAADWAGRLAAALSPADADEPKRHELRMLMRLYALVHCDHEGSNACAYACHTAGSTLADPYLALSAGWRALAGPIHGLASQVCLEFIESIYTAHGVPYDAALLALCQARMAAGKVIPGFGHAVLRDLDPRYELLRAFAQLHFPDDDYFRIADGLYRVVPPLLQSTGKVASPWPNVDGITGAVLHHYGLRDYGMLTVLFATCMSLGMLAQYVLNRGLGTPLMRPRSTTTARLRQSLSA